MNKLPVNPYILLSVINTKLRDQYSSLEILCDDLEENLEEINSLLNPLGYYYNSSNNQFIQK